MLIPNRRYQPFLLVAICQLSCCLPIVTSFILSPKSILEPSRRSLSSTPFPICLFSSNQEPTPSRNDNYNDDAFGLVFLGGVTFANDVIFAGIFLVLSAVAATATKQGKLPASNQVPAAVAGLTILLLPVLTTALVDVLPSSIPSPDASSPSIELALCSISMLYGFFLAPKIEDKQ